MKTRLFSLLVAMISLSAFSQCHLGFYNDSSRLFVIGNPLPGDPTGPIPASPLPSGHSLVAQLFAGTNADSMILQASSLLDTNGWGGGGAEPIPGLMNPVHLVLNGVPCGEFPFFNVVISDVVGAIGSPFVPGPAPGAVYYGTSGTFTGYLGGAISYPPVWSLGGTSTWPATNLVINAVQPVLNFAGTNVLTWVGTYTLQSATNVIGPYGDVPGAVSPYTNSASLPLQFFRLRQ